MASYKPQGFTTWAGNIYDVIKEKLPQPYDVSFGTSYDVNFDANTYRSSRRAHLRPYSYGCGLCLAHGQGTLLNASRPATGLSVSAPTVCGWRDTQTITRRAHQVIRPARLAPQAQG